MIAVDTNLLLYALREENPLHGEARAALETLAQSREPWAIPWPCMHEFFSIATHPKVYKPPTPVAVTLDAMQAWMESPSLQLLSESSTHWATLQSLVLGAHVEGPMVHDARIAAICIDHGVRELWTADRDFYRFPRLTVVNPLVLA